MIDNNLLHLSAQRALLFNIKSIVRFIFLNLNENNGITLNVYISTQPKEEDCNIFYSVVAEIGGDFAEVDDSKNEVHIFKYTDKFEGIKDVGLLIYARYEIGIS